MSAPKKTNKTRLWFLVHSWLALPIWCFVLIVCVTGTLAVVSQEIIWLANPQVRANAPDDDRPPLTYGQVLAALERAEPSTVVRSLQAPLEGHFALTAEVSRPDGTSRTLYVNPWTGAIQGTAPEFDFKAFTRALHGWWLAPWNHGYSWGWYLVSLLGLPMLASLVTGLVVYKKFWRAYLRPRLRIGQGSRIFWGDLHRLLGIWSVPFIAIISVTGIWFLIQAVLFDNSITISSEGPPAIVSRQDPPTLPDGAPGLNLDAAIARAQDAGIDVDAINLPGNAFDYITLNGRGWYPLMHETALINPYTGQLDSSRRLSDRTPLEFVTESMRPLHTGDFAGLISKMIWMVFGLALCFMVASGLMIWLKRTAQATAQAMRRSDREVAA